MPSLQRPNGIVEIPYPSSHLHTFKEAAFLPGDGIEESGLPFAGESPAIRRIEVYEVRPSIIAVECRLFPKSRVVHEPRH